MLAQHILVPTDFSEYADNALNYAIELAQAIEARLTILHAFYLSALALEEVAPAVLDVTLEAMENHVQKQIQIALERIQRTGLKGESIIVDGTPVEAIIETAKNKGVDLIVIGTHGRTGLTHALIGSVAEKVVRLASCPVIVTRGTA